MTTTDRETIQSINPATRQIIGTAPIMSAAQVKTAVASAWQAFAEWRLIDFRQRANKLLDFRRVLVEAADQVASLITDEVGKPLVESYLAELNGPLDSCGWLANEAGRILQDQVIHLANPLLISKSNTVVFEPLGVVGIIAPWNYPFSIPTMTMLAALMAGNAVILKPSEKSPLIGMKIGELFERAGFAKGLVTILPGDSRTGEALTREKLGRLIFTGSVAGGTKVMAQAAPNMTPLTLELGGKDPAIVLPDAPPDWTAKGLVWGAFTNAGQACASIERVYIVQGKETQQLLERLAYHTRNLKVGLPKDPATELGPVIDESQLEKILNHIEEAKSLGAAILYGGKRRNDLGGYFLEPTILTGVNHRMKIMTEETFGPVLPIMIVDTVSEAVALANDSIYGLTASVWSSNLKRAKDVARDLDAGTVYVNDCLFSHAVPEAPWGGLKKSGLGRSHSQFGLFDLVNIKYISSDTSDGMNRIWWYPYGKAKIKSARGGIRFLYGSSLAAKWQGFWDFVSFYFRH